MSGEKLFKIIFYGDSCTGKTAVLDRYERNIFNNNGLTTMGIVLEILNSRLVIKKLSCNAMKQME